MTNGPDVNHRMYVVESKTEDIFGPYGEPVLINTDSKSEFYAIDGSVFAHPNGKAYFVWAGHHSFFKSPDGREDWIAYHAKTTSEYTYSGRSTRAQRVHWTDDGMIAPIVPQSLDTDIPQPSGAH